MNSFKLSTLTLLLITSISLTTKISACGCGDGAYYTYTGVSAKEEERKEEKKETKDILTVFVKVQGEQFGDGCAPEENIELKDISSGLTIQELRYKLERLSRILPACRPAHIQFLMDERIHTLTNPKTKLSELNILYSKERGYYIELMAY